MCPLNTVVDLRIVEIMLGFYVLYDCIQINTQLNRGFERVYSILESLWDFG